VGTQTFTVLAEELGGTARAELWPKLVAEWPQPERCRAREGECHPAAGRLTHVLVEQAVLHPR
jgi:hypothetical protein